MCGITGFLLSNKSTIDLNSTILKMTDTLNHRGPDNSNSWHSESKRVALGHTRLSILDLSKNGSQPMIDKNNRFIIIYNGEIYNHKYLRDYLNKNYNNEIKWYSHSDTETLLNCISYIGMSKTLEMLDGMFAFAVFDYKKNNLTLVRDRFGQKPLYYGWVNNNFVFSSELKAFKKFRSFNNNLNLKALSLYFKFMYVPAPYSIYEEIYKLRPGYVIDISLQDNYFDIKNTNNYSSKYFTYKRWWSLEDQIIKSKNNKFSNYNERLNYLSTSLEDTISDQLISDVPVGCFLSGGIDSSIVTSIMSNVSSKKINTFSVGVNNLNYDESKYAKKISTHLQTDHNELIVSEKNLIDTVDKIPKIYDEPFADSSQIPTFLISKFAREKIKVVLTGDGGDELFGGYNRYVWASKSWNIIKYLPFTFRKRLSNILLNLPQNLIKIFLNVILKIFKININNNNSLEKLNKFLIKLESVRNQDEMYFSLITEWKSNENIISRNIEVDEFSEFINPNISLSYQEKMMYWDSLTYLPDDILCKVDRASMSVGLESRLPFLGNKVVDAAWTIPLKMKIKNQNTKVILKDILGKYLPYSLFDRPKMGFSIPIGSWFRNQLKDFVYDNLSKDSLQKHNILNNKIIDFTLTKHMDQNHDYQHKIWSVLMFQLWMNEK